MLKSRGRDPRQGTNPTPAQFANKQQTQPSMTRLPTVVPSSSRLTLRTPIPQRAQIAKPEPDYEVVDFPSEQYVNAKLQPPPPPPPRPPTGHPAEAGASCGLCGGGGARVRCAECGRRALCASCDDMYHRHPKRRHHQRQALSLSQMRDDRPPLPPKVAPPVPPPRRHKISGDRTSASPRPPSGDGRGGTFNAFSMMQTPNTTLHPNNHMNHMSHQSQPIPVHLQGKIGQISAAPHIGSMPYLPNMHVATVAQPQTNTLGHLVPGWNRPRTSLPGFNVPPNVQMAVESWEGAEGAGQGWGRPLRRGASVLELGGAGAGCGGWRYGSCASLDHQQWGWQPPCCVHGMPPPHAHVQAPYTPQPYRRADSRTLSRAQSRTCSRAASPAMSTRSRTSRRTRHRTPSPPPLPSSDADSESESDTDRRAGHYPEKPEVSEPIPEPVQEQSAEDSLGPAPPPPTASWQCEHCTFVNEPGVRVCVICCRTPTAAPKIIDNVSKRIVDEVSRNENARSIAASERAVVETARSIAHLDINDGVSNASTSPTKPNKETRFQNGVVTKGKSNSKKERTSTGCGPSPPRDEPIKKPLNRLITPTREHNTEPVKIRHDMAVGSSPPKEVQRRDRTTDTSVRESPYRENVRTETTVRHSVSVGPSPPCDISERVSPALTVQKKSTGTSPPRHNNAETLTSVTSTRANVSNTGTSPPPQSISTQTYEVPSTFERPASRSRSRRRFRDEVRSERSHSRHSLSSDTRESERTSVGGGGGGGGGEGSGRWEWRWGRDSSPGGDCSGGERRRPPARLARRASHLDLHRARAPPRRSSYYGSEAASPEPARAVSLEALAGASAAAERGMELARLMTSAEQLGFSAAEVHAALAQSPAAPLAWLRERWGGLCAGVAAAVARLEPRARPSALEARAALARHRGAMWPAVTDCLDRYRSQAGGGAAVSGAARVSGRVWGSPAGAEDDAAPPRRAEGSSDEADFRDDGWMYLPLDANPKKSRENDPYWEPWDLPFDEPVYGAPDVDPDLNRLLAPSFDRSLIETLLSYDRSTMDGLGGAVKSHAVDFIQSESDFIEAYNALTRLSPLPGIKSRQEDATEMGSKRDTYDVPNNDTLSSIDNNKEALINENIITHQAAETFKGTINSGEQNIIVSTEDKFEAISDNLNDNMDRSLLPTSLSNTHDLTNTVEITNNLTHSLAVTNSQRIAQNNYNTEEITRRTPTSVMDRTPINKNVIPPQPITINKQMMATENNSNNINESVRQEDEKLNNLNDIVDTTQRLIQQMKEEINSDINSIDSRNISQSDADSSSNESSDISTEHESSYSESEDETDNLTSKDSASSAEESEIIHLSERRPTIIQRTSSEENDQFEEAMDHIEDHINDFKNTNIELLDSIARSLQEERTISVEVKNSKNENNMKRKDKNNNIFVKVNSFEEIYAELNTDDSVSANNDNKPNEHLQPKDRNKNETDIVLNDDFENTSQTVKIDIPKHQIILSTFQMASPTKLLFFENISSKYNAVIETPNENINLREANIGEDNTERVIDINVSNITTTSENPEQVLISDDEENESSSSATIQHAPVKTVIKTDNLNINNDEIIIENKINDENTTSDLNNSNENLNINEPDNQLDHIPIYSIDSNTTPVPKNAQVVSKEHSDNNMNKFSNSIKSNIPKLIKFVQGNKQKVDKPSPKIISSKVPIRKTSQKQYPAPAPPKSHFGNIQSGHVKKLQTRLFNYKLPKASVNVPTGVEAKPSVAVQPSAEVETSVEVEPSVQMIPALEVKPSTSTLNKKKQAPAPPVIESKQTSPPKTLAPKEKKGSYFRESCRTEDEWTDSESDDSQIQVVKTSNEPERAPSPPPPLTLRRVSGQIIDLAKVQLPEGSPERQARMLLAQGASETWAQARLAVELAAGGAEPAAALLAALECADLPAALAYLHQDCELCASRLPEHEMVSMLRCTHRCCRECARHYFTVQITERSIADCVCPYCKMPDLEDLSEDAWLEYFAHLDILLKTLLESEVHELFQRKLRDRTLAREPNFRWCMECSSGFFVHPKQKRVRCPECRSQSCAKCRKPWSSNHEGLSCEQYLTWLEDNDPERSVAAVQQHLRENGLECPRCHFKYSLSRGGCMHFTCTQCKYEFCNGCGKPFMMGARCGLSDYCAKLGLHAHHPRNCLFYLRDKEPHQLQTLLQMNNVPYETEAPEGSPNRCPIQLQRETPTGLVDGTCGSEVPPKHAGLCKNHYLEYLSRVVRARGVDPLPLLDAEDLETLVRRAALRLPPRPYGSLDGVFRRALLQIVKEKIPLD